MMQASPHISVLRDEVVQYMAPKDGELYVDGTFGAGGYSRALLEKADCQVIGIDRDPDVKEFAEALAQEFPGRVRLVQGRIGEMEQVLAEQGITAVNGVMLDLGVSSMQLDRAERGFSFQADGPLDMRMGKEGRSAETLVNEADERELADIIYRYGEERMSRRIARAIVEERQKQPITRTLQLARIVRSVVKGSHDKIDPATRTFQALRIWVNDELEELEQALKMIEKLLLPGGRVVVVSFHSLEDSIVKRFLNEKAGKTEGVSRHMPVVAEALPALLVLLTNKAVKPSEQEIRRNPRSRSARLRAAMKQ